LTEEKGPRAVLFVALFLILVLAAAALWVPRWWENRQFRQAEALTGVGSRVLPGGVTGARGKINPGDAGRHVVDAIGRPSFSFGTEGSSTHEIWTYYYADGTMTVNLTDGIVARITISYGPPKIPTSARP
jgi:flagellar basal body-associated protein FliL